MRISRIFTEAPLQTLQLVTLEERASHHLSKVLRLQVGAKLLLFNGDGKQYPAVIDSLQKKQVCARILDCETVSRESPLQSHLGIAISKGDRMDLVMQKATELGVTTITPLISEHTEVKFKPERQEKKFRHWQQVIISACEQCERNQLPRLKPLQTLDEWTATISAEKKLVLHHRAEQRLDPSQKVSSAALLIGPEGGLSDREIALALAREFCALGIGPRVLRTETAPLAALAILQFCWGDA